MQFRRSAWRDLLSLHSAWSSPGDAFKPKRLPALRAEECERILSLAATRMAVTPSSAGGDRPHHGGSGSQFTTTASLAAPITAAFSCTVGPQTVTYVVAEDATGSLPSDLVAVLQRQDAPAIASAVKAWHAGYASHPVDSVLVLLASEAADPAKIATTLTVSQLQPTHT